MRRIWPTLLLLMFLPVVASAQPSIVSVDPTSAFRGESVGVRITGSETLFLQGSEVTSVVFLSRGTPQIDATSVTVLSATSLDATFEIPIDAALGFWDVTVEQIDGVEVTLVDGFTVLSNCAITDLAAGGQSACDPATNTYTQDVIVTFESPPTFGNLSVNGQTFAIGTSPQTVTLTSLVADGAPVDVNASFSGEPECSRMESALFTAPPNCEVQPCAITDLAASAQSSCNPETNTYTQDIIVTFENPPGSGNLMVNGQSFAIGTSPQTVTLEGLVADGANVDVTASFSADPECSRTESALFTAPPSCEVQPCAITDLMAGEQSSCNPATNTYTQDIIVTFENAPGSGNLVVNGQSFAIGTSPQTVTLTGLVADGAEVDVDANFSANLGCSRTESALFTAPPSCAVQPCAITDLMAGNQTPCNPETNTYSQDVTVTYDNPPGSGNLVVNGQSFAIGSSPQTVTLTGLVADGGAVDVTANFSAEPDCARTESGLFAAPASCELQPCAISDLMAGNQTPCNPATNTYTQEVIVTFENAPGSGNLVVNGQSFAIGASPQTVTLTDLVADGASVNVTANFSADTQCSRTETALFTAPANCQVDPCAITDLAAGDQTSCNPSTNTYTQEIIVTFENPPASGSLVVNGQSFAIGTSPQTVTLVGLDSDGAAVDVTASFSADAGCELTETALFTAPQRCREGQPPDCSQAKPSRDVLWPPNHKFKKVKIKGVTDPDGEDVEITITSVTSDEPVDGRGDGQKCPDAIIRDDGSVKLRAERSGKGNGRVYTIHFTATDESGDSCDGTVFVCVPHDKGKKDDDDDGCIRDEFQYDATRCNAAKASVPELPATRPVVARVADEQVTIQFTNTTAGLVDLRIYDLRGRLVRRLAARDFPAGAHVLHWDGRDARGREAASGIYLVRAVLGGKPYTTRTVWMR